MDELGLAVIKVLNAQIHRKWTPSGVFKNIAVKCVGLSWDVTHYNSVRCTHHAPAGHPINWGSDHNLPIGYHGWYGRVWVRYSNENKSLGCDPFPATLTHTGSGGWGGYDGPWQAIESAHFKRYRNNSKLALYSWDYSIFDLDWPEIIDIRDQIMMDMFEGKAVMSTIQHKFLWEDPATKAADEVFLLITNRLPMTKN